MTSPAKHWKYINDKNWTKDEVTALIMEEVGHDTVRPVGHNLLVKLLKRKEKTSGGILIPETSRDQDKHYTRVGRVLDMGSYAYNKRNWPDGPFCHIGDYICFRQYQWSDCPVKGVDLVNVPCDKADDILDPEKVKDEGYIALG
jgi:co-chaperonin GroES (HSP10)